MQIAGSRIFITGASRGIGLALAKALASYHTNLHIQMREAQPTVVDELLKLGAKSVKVWIADLEDRAQTARLIENLKPENIDILVNNAGQLTGGLLEEQDFNDILRMFQVNLLSLVQITHGLLPGMLQRKKGLIVNNASVSGLMHFPCASTYAAAKSAVIAFTNCLELELKGTGVGTLCLITPGINTRMFAEIAPKYEKNIKVPQGSITPEQYARQICYAISSEHTALLPSGATRVALLINRHLPSVFKWIAHKQFHR